MNASLKRLGVGDGVCEQPLAVNFLSRIVSRSVFVSQPSCTSCHFSATVVTLRLFAVVLSQV